MSVSELEAQQIRNEKSHSFDLLEFDHLVFSVKIADFLHFYDEKKEIGFQAKG